MRRMRIAIVTDAWKPQINGVVQTLSQTRDELKAMGHDILMVTPENRRTMPMPTYPEIRLSLFPGRSVQCDLDDFDPDCIHIATEGPLGLAARRYCRRRRRPFTSAYHTRFPEYVKARFPVPIAWTTSLLRWFHGAAVRTIVPTETIRRQLVARGFSNLVIWSRGVDTALFKPDQPHDYGLPGPVFVYVGHVAVEKNTEAFLGLALPGSKVVIGDGPDRRRLEAAYPDCHFLGYRFGRELAARLAGGDVFVFPSRTDTFGLVMLEAMACGLPVAALPVPGPIDVVQNGITGMLDDDLTAACLKALTLDRADCQRFAEGRSWRRSTNQFQAYLAPRVLETASDQPVKS